MEMTIDQAELFPTFPTIAATARKRTPLREIMDAIEKHGALIPQAFTHVALDISKQRAHQLITAGRIATIEVAGKSFVPIAAIDIYLSEERNKGGRPAKAQPSIRRMFSRAYAK
jgi:hypothetical protein